MERTLESKKVARELTVERQRNAVSGGASERTKVVHLIGGLEVRHLIENHLGMSARPYAHGTRHCGLEVRAADKRNHRMPLAECAQCGRQCRHLSFKRKDLVLDVQAHIHGNLIVAAAPGVNLLSKIAESLCEPALHRHVNILVGLADLELPVRELLHNLRKLAAHFRRLCGRHHRRNALRHLHA